MKLYEEWELIHKPERKSNGYRIYNDIHIKQFELAREYIRIAKQEIENAKEAAGFCENLYCRKHQDDGIFYKRSQATKDSVFL